MVRHQQPQKRKWALYSALLLTLVVGFTSCKENAINNLSPADSPVYITNYDRSINFNQYKTFSLPDSVVIESNTGYQPSLGPIESRFVSNVASAFTSRGFQRVNRGQAADLGVAIIRVNNLYTGVGVDPYGYYGGYWGGGFGGLGGYNLYYPSYYTYQVADQYWEIQVVDLKNRPTTSPGTETQLNVLYSATIRGADVTTQPDVDAATTAIFNQSPYLRTSN